MSVLDDESKLDLICICGEPAVISYRCPKEKFWNCFSHELHTRVVPMKFPSDSLKIYHRRVEDRNRELEKENAQLREKLKLGAL